MATRTKEVGIRLSVKDKDVVERALKQLGAEGEASLKRIERAGKPASVSLQALNAATGGARSAMASFAIGATGALAAFLSVGAAVEGTKAALDAFGKIADQAKSTGLDAEFFQGIAYQASLAGVATDELAGALETYAKNAGLAAVGKGKMVSTLKALNPELLRNIQLATSQEERVRIAADAINKAQAGAQRAALSAALFGDQGTKIAAAFEGGAAALDLTIKKAKDLGLIVDRDVIAKADALGDEFETTTKILDLKVKQALINLGPILVWLSGLAGDLAGQLGDTVASWQKLGDRSTSNIQKELEGLRHQKELSGWVEGTTSGPDTDMRIKMLEQEIFRRGERGSMLKLSASNPPVTPDIPSTPSAEAKKAIRDAEELTKKLRDASEAYGDTIEDLDKKLAAGLIDQTTYNRASAEAAIAFAKAADTSQEYSDALERLDAAKAKGILTEQQYTEAVVALTKKRLLAQNDWFSGVQLGLMNLQGGADDVTKSVASAVENWATSLGDAIGEVFRTGKFEWKDLVNTILADIAKIATQQLITKPLAALLGSLFGGINLGGAGGGTGIGAGAGAVGGVGGNAAGTDYWRGGPTWVGERGPEIVNLPRGAQVIPNHKLGGNNVAVTLNANYNVDGSNLSQGQLQAVLENHSKTLLDAVPGVVKKAMARGSFG